MQVASLHDFNWAAVPDCDEGSSVQWSEQWVKLLTEVALEGVDVWAVLGIVEWDLALLVVKVNAQAFWYHRQGQCRLRLGAGVELMCTPPQGPVAFAGAHGEAPVTFRGARGHSDPPITIVGQVHLPVVAPAWVTLPAQHAGPAVVALRAVWKVRFLVRFHYFPLVIRDQEPGVVGHGIQSDISCRMKENTKLMLHPGTRSIILDSLLLLLFLVFFLK